MSVCYFLKYNGNYSMRSGSFWNYYRDEMNDDAQENNDDNYRVNNEKPTTSKSFQHKTKNNNKHT